MNAHSSRPGSGPSRRLRAHRRSLLFSCALGTTLVLAGQATPARAQAINATPSTAGGNVTYSRFGTPTPNTETITVQTQQAIINWTPPGSATNPYVFLPSGNTVTFQNGVNVSNFAVLNRILTTLPSRFDGTVISQLRDASGNVTGRGGTVVFSSPGGIIVGSTAVFDVGNLVLTSLTVAEDGYGNFLSPNGGFQYELSGDENSGSIITEAGSQINALTGNSYVALVAPQVTHAGAIRVNGSAGFIAAEDVSFSVNEGLFDIQVTTGSGNAIPIVHTGSTGGPASTGGTDNHRVYMVAVPKNQAITMLLSGSVGFDAAVSASVENGQIILAGGHNIDEIPPSSTNCPTTSCPFRDTAPASQFDSNITIENGNFTSNVEVRTLGALRVQALTGSLNFTGNVALLGARSLDLLADAGHSLMIAGNLTGASYSNRRAEVGTVRVSALGGGLIDVVGTTDLRGDAFNLFSSSVPPGFPEFPQAGQVLVTASGGTIRFHGNATFAAEGDSDSSMDSRGGTVSLLSSAGGLIAFGQNVILDVGATSAVTGTVAGDERGGTAEIVADGGRITVSGNVVIEASTNVSTGFGATSGGAHTGGTARLLALNGGNIAIAGSAALRANANGVPGTGGGGTGGILEVTADGGALALDGTLTLTASALGASAPTGSSAIGGAGTGGTVNFLIRSTDSRIGGLSINLRGRGGSGGVGATGGAGTGGTASLNFISTNSTLGTVSIDVRGLGGSGGSGGATGTSIDGTATLIAQASNIQIRALNVDGGDFELTIDGSALTVDDDLTVDASGDIIIGAVNGGGLQASGDIDISGGGNVSISRTAADGDLFADAGGNLSLLESTSGGDLFAFAGETLSLVDSTSGGDLFADAGGNLSTTVISAGQSMTLTAFGNIATGSLTAGTDITVDATGDVIVGFAQAGDDFMASASGTFTGGTLISSGLGADTEVDSSSSLAGSNIEVFTFGDLRLDNGDAFDNLRLTSVGANVLSDGLLDAGAAMVLRAGSDTGNIVDILINDASAGTTMDLSATGGLVADTLNAGGTITGFFGTDVTVNGIGTGGSLLLFADGAVDLGTVVAADDVLVDPTSITIDSVTAGDDIDLDATGDITVGFAQAGDDFTANAGGIFTGGTVIVTGLGTDDEAGYGSGSGSNIFVDSNGNLTLDNGSAPDTIDLASATGSVLSAGTLTANQLLVSAALNIDLNDVDVVSSLFLSTPNGFIDGNNFSSDGGISLSASGGVTLAGADSGSFLFINAGGAADLGTLVSDSSITIFAPSILLDSATAGADINLDASGDIIVGFAQAGDDFTASAGGIFTGGTVIATGLGPDNEAGYGSLEGANIVIDSNGNLTLTNGDAADAISLTSFNASVLSTGLLEAGTDIDIAAVQTADLASLVAGNNITVDPVTIIIDSAIAGGDITLAASADITVGFAQAGDDFVANAGTTFTGTTVIAQGVKDSEAGVGPLAGGNIVVAAGTDLRLDNGNAADDIRLTSRAGSIFSSNLLTAGSDVVADAAQDIDVVTVDAGEFISLFAGGFVDATSLIAGNSITSTSGGATTIAAADAGDSIFVSAGGAAGLGTLVAGEDIFVDAASITLANGTAGSDISLGATGNIDVVLATVGDDFDANAGGTFNGTTIVATGGPDDDLIEGPFPGSNIIVDAVGDLRLDTGTAPDLIDLASSGGSIFSAGTLTADTLLATAALDLLLNDVFVVTDLNLTTANGDIAGNSFNSDGNINLDSAGSVTLADADSGGDIDVAAGSNADLGTFVAAGDILVDAASIAFTSATAGGDVGLAASGDIGVTFAQAGDDFVANAGGAFTAGTVTVTGSGTDSEGGAGALAGSNIQVDANGNLRLDNGTAPGAIDLASVTGSILSSGTLTADRLVADAALDIALNNVSVVADLALTTPGGSISGNSFDSGGDISLDAAGSVTLAAADSGGNIDVAAGTTATLGTFVAVGDILVDANGNVRLDNGTASGTIDLASATASVLSSGTLAANRLLVDAAEDIALNNVDVVAALILTAANGSISGNSFESDGNISLDAADDVVLAAADSGGALLIAAGATADLGTLTAATDIGVDAGQINLAGATAGRDITLDAAGDIDVGNAQAGRNFTADAGGDGAFNNLIAGSVAISVLGNASFDGAVRAPTISVVSSDIDVAGTASIGDSATQLVTLTALATGQATVLGGSTEGPGYTLTDAEADRVTSALFRVQAPQNGSGANRPADVLVRDLSLAGQRIGTFALFTGGIVQVEGGLLLSSVRSGGGIQIQAGERLQVLTPTGSIRVRDAAGLTDGALTITSNNIWSADQALLGQLRADPNFTGRDQALLTNNGPVELRGYLEAGDVTLSARDTLFVQNSGSLISFAGITVRQNTLRIVPTGTQPLRVFAFGRRINPDGSFVTNTPFFAEVEFEGRGGAVGYTDESQFNLCFINSGVCRLPSPDQTLPGGSEIIEEPVDGSDDGARDGGSPPNNELVDTSFADEPLIEEPVTSGGDSILWDCDNDDDGDCDEEDYDG